PEDAHRVSAPAPATLDHGIATPLIVVIREQHRDVARADNVCRVYPIGPAPGDDLAPDPDLERLEHAGDQAFAKIATIARAVADPLLGNPPFEARSPSRHQLRAAAQPGRRGADRIQFLQIVVARPIASSQGPIE